MKEVFGIDSYPYCHRTYKGFLTVPDDVNWKWKLSYPPNIRKTVRINEDPYIRFTVDYDLATIQITSIDTESPVFKRGTFEVEYFTILLSEDKGWSKFVEDHT